MKPVAIPDANLTARVVRRCHLIEIQAGVGSSTFFRYTDNNPGSVVVTIDAVLRTFTRYHFVPSNIVTTNEGQQNCEVTFMDAAQLAKAIGLNFEMRNWPVTLWEHWFDAAGASVGTEVLISGVCDGLLFQEAGQTSRATLGIIAGDRTDQAEGPRQEASIGCQFQYKDDQCAAVSLLPTCGYTVPQCIERNNLDRYGGFPYGPTPGTKLTWGPHIQVVRGRDMVN
jgi:hypothetical protein